MVKNALFKYNQIVEENFCRVRLATAVCADRSEMGRPHLYVGYWSRNCRAARESTRPKIPRQEEIERTATSLCVGVRGADVYQANALPTETQMLTLAVPLKYIQRKLLCSRVFFDNKKFNYFYFFIKLENNLFFSTVNSNFLFREGMVLNVGPLCRDWNSISNSPVVNISEREIFSCGPHLLFCCSNYYNVKRS